LWRAEEHKNREKFKRERQKMQEKNVKKKGEIEINESVTPRAVSEEQ